MFQEYTYIFHLFSCTTGKAVAGAGKESLPCSSTEALQPAPANSSLPHTQPPFLHRNSTPMAVPTKEKRSRKRPSQSCNDPSQGTSGEHVSASTSSTGVSGRTSSTGQVAVDQHCTSKHTQSVCVCVCVSALKLHHCIYSCTHL